MGAIKKIWGGVEKIERGIEGQKRRDCGESPLHQIIRRKVVSYERPRRSFSRLPRTDQRILHWKGREEITGRKDPYAGVTGSGRG